MANQYQKKIDPDLVPSELNILTGDEIEQLLALRGHAGWGALAKIYQFMEDQLRNEEWKTRSFKDTNAVFDSGVRHGEVAMMQFTRDTVWASLEKELERRKQSIDSAKA